jgi:hypothetical protein
MSNLSAARPPSRVHRGPGPKQKLRAHNYRSRSLPFLLEDFEHRCAYSMQHSSTLGVKTMEVDHFNPRLPQRLRHQYTNLYLASRHCNNSKRQSWPTAAQISQGIRFLDCCREQDYDQYIFEDAVDHRVYGVTPAGKYHVRMCDLNAPHLIRERKIRAGLRVILSSSPAIIRRLEKNLELSNLLKLLTDIADRLIPPISSGPNRTFVI